VVRPEPELLGLDIPVAVGGVPRKVVRRSGTDAKPLLRLDGVDSRSAAEALKGEPILVSREHVAPLEEDEWWADDLVGLRVVDGDREVGVVARVLSLPSCEVLEVGELLIPLVGDAVRDVDVAAGVVDVDLAFLDAG
jgi:16S rRNA processing protein RimM